MNTIYAIYDLLVNRGLKEYLIVDGYILIKISGQESRAVT
jgi:hypothetical protein